MSGRILPPLVRQPPHKPAEGLRLAKALREWAEETGHEGVAWDTERSMHNILDVARINSKDSGHEHWVDGEERRMEWRHYELRMEATA